MCDQRIHEAAHAHVPATNHERASGSSTHGHARGGDFRLVVTGKGGVGKTSVTAVLARVLSRSGNRVLALDADPQMSLPYALGVDRDTARSIVPLSRRADYVEEKTGARTGFGQFLRLNPDVQDVVERFGIVAPDGVRVVVMGTVVQPAMGCLCPENTLLAAVASHVSLRRGEAVLMDTQAGVEHFGRSLANGFRHAAVVTDSTFNAVQVALHAARLAAELGIPKVHLVVNRVRAPRDVERVRRLIADEGGFPFASEHSLPFDSRLIASEPAVSALLEPPKAELLRAVETLCDVLSSAQAELPACV